MLLVLVLSTLQAQDIHFSQFYNQPLVLNPSHAGLFKGDQRIRVAHRNQWSNVVPWQTFSASYDRKFIPRLCQSLNSFFSGGIALNYDRSSEISDLTLSNINLLGSFATRLDSSGKHWVSVGAVLGFATRGFDRNILTWDSQWDLANFQFNPGSASGETFESESVSYMETGLGVNYRWRSDEDHTWVDVGLGVYHLIEPSVSYYDVANVKLAQRYTLTTVGQFKASEKVDVQVFGLAQFQGPYREAVVGALQKFYLNRKPGRHLELHLGLGYRFDVAWFPILALQFNNFYGSLSYDLDATHFNSLKGIQPNTIELHFGYIITNPKWARRCPLY